MTLGTEGVICVGRGKKDETITPVNTAEDKNVLIAVQKIVFFSPKLLLFYIFLWLGYSFCDLLNISSSISGTFVEEEQVYSSAQDPNNTQGILSDFNCSAKASAQKLSPVGWNIFQDISQWGKKIYPSLVSELGAQFYLAKFYVRADK